MLSLANKLIRISNNNNGSKLLFKSLNNSINYNSFGNRFYSRLTASEEEIDEDFERDFKRQFRSEREATTIQQQLEEEVYADVDSRHPEKVQKSKRVNFLKKNKRISPVEVFRSEIDKNRDSPKVDYVEGKLHSFPPLPGTRRIKLRDYEGEDVDDYKNEYNEYEEIEDEDEFIDDEAIQNYGNDQVKRMGFVSPDALGIDVRKDFDAEDYERGFYNAVDMKRMKGQFEYVKRKEAERDEKRKRKLVKLGFKDIDQLEKRRTELAQQLREKGDRRLKPFKYPILSDNSTNLALLSLNFFKLTILIGEKILYNDDVLDIDKVSVVDVDGSKIGDMSGAEAYRLAYNKKTDIFINYTPVGHVIGRLMRMEDFISVTEKRYLEEDQKKMDSATKPTKNVLFSSGISSNDKATKIQQVKNFLLKRHTVEVTLTFKNEIEETLAEEFFKEVDAALVGIAKSQAKYGKKGGKIASNFYHPLNAKDRENYIKRIQKEDTESERKLREQLEREEIDYAEERGMEPDMTAITIKVNEIIRKKKMEEMFDESDLNLLLEDERKQNKKNKNQSNQQKLELAPTKGEGLSNKEIKQNINKNKNKLKKQQNDEDELF